MKTIWFFIQLLKPRQKWVGLGTLLATLTLIGGVALLSLSGWFISAAAGAGLSLTTALAFNYFLPSAGVRFFALLRILSRYFERVVSHEAIFRVLSDLRVWVYKSLEPLAPGHLLRYRSGDLMSRMVADVDILNNLYIRVLSPLLASLTLMGLLLIYVAFFNVSIACLLFTFMLFTLLVVPMTLALLGKNTGQLQNTIEAHLRTQLVDSIQGMADLLLLGRLEEYTAQLIQHNKTWIRTQRKMAMIQGLASGLMVLLSGLTMWLVVYCAIPIVTAHHLNGANIALLALTALAAFEALAPITLAAQFFSKIKASAERLHSIAQAKPEVIFPEHSAPLPTRFDLEWKNISFGYVPEPLVLKNFSLKINQGEHLALVGATGSGKSTVAQLMARFFNPHSGQLLIGGVPIETLSESDLRNTVTLITQRPHLFSATLRDNLRIANPEASDAELTQALAQIQLKTWFEQLPEGLNTWVGEGGIQLSGGQLRRLSVARAVLHHAPIWLLDEPTEGLDQETEAVFWETLMPLMRDKTVLIITHQLEKLPKISQTIRL